MIERWFRDAGARWQAAREELYFQHQPEESFSDYYKRIAVLKLVQEGKLSTASIARTFIFLQSKRNSLEKKRTETDVPQTSDRQLFIHLSDGIIDAVLALPEIYTDTEEIDLDAMQAMYKSVGVFYNVWQPEDEQALKLSLDQHIKEMVESI